ncbi:MAG: spermidine synthase [Candidatus Eisenbacteria bacterium]|nr:spermidine synthase [Candidatus Eisenbacteria bacterium]
MGELVLRRRRSSSVPDEPVYEVKLDDEMLMSSAVNASERALARLTLERRGDEPSDVLIGGLGLGYTAAAALEFACVRRLLVIELLHPVIAWHLKRLVPTASALLDDPRCTLVEGDFFEHVAPGAPVETAVRYDAILLDIDHSPESWLQLSHGGFYTATGIGGLSEHLRPGGVFGIWSASEPSQEFLDLLGSVLLDPRSHEISFLNPHVGETDSNWVVVAGRTR